jgi:hypothetical protein
VTEQDADPGTVIPDVEDDEVDTETTEEDADDEV